MVAFDATGNVRWIVPGDQPQIATADGGVIGQSGIAYDANGNATGTTSASILAWTGTAYQAAPLSEVNQVWTAPVDVATTWSAFEQPAQQVPGPASNGAAAELPAYTLHGPTMVKTVYNQANPNVWDCAHENVGPFGEYGYQECASYTVFDKGNPPRQIVRGGLEFDERFNPISKSTNLKNIIEDHGNAPTDENGVLTDDLIFVQTKQNFPPGTYLIKEQIITLHSTGSIVRVNCLDFEVADVFVTDITTQYDPKADPKTQCQRKASN